MRFVVIASPRTGSSYLVNLLSAHPDVFTNGNVFDSRETVYVFWPDATPDLKRELMAMRRADPYAFLERIYSSGYGRHHVGFKIFSGENDEILDSLIRDAAIKKIVLFRRNVLACYSSALVARKTRKYSATVETQQPLVEFRRRQFIKFFNHYTSFYRSTILKLNNFKQNYYLLHYEDTMDGYILSSVLNFIGADTTKELDNSMQNKKLIKQNSSNILARFQNQEEVVAFVSARGLSHWLHEGETSLLPLPLGAHGNASADDDIQESNPIVNDVPAARLEKL